MKRQRLLFILICGILTASCMNFGSKTITDGNRTITYKTIQEAENQLLDIICSSRDNWAFPSKLFMELVVNDDRCFDYDFYRLIEASSMATVRPLEVITSEDGRLRLYSWDSDGGTMSSYSGITSVRNKKNVHSYASSEDDYGSKENFSAAAYGAQDLQIVTKNNQDKIYMVQKLSSGSKIMNSLIFEAYSIDGGDLVPCSVFPGESGYSTSMSQDIDFSLYNGKYDFLNGTELQIPETRPSENPYGAPLTTDRYLAYEFDGERYRYKAIYYPKDLCDELCNYKYNLSVLKDGQWVIRLDVMKDRSVRYAAWKKKSISETPSLILHDGYRRSSGMRSYASYGGDREQYESYVFENYEYSYEYSWTWDFRFESTCQIYKTLHVIRDYEILMTLEE